MTDLYQILADSYFRCLDTVHGLKALVIDALSASSLATAVSQRQLLAHEVAMSVFIEQLADLAEEGCPSLPAVVVFRPTPAVLECLAKELKSPHFGTYNLFFIGKLSQDQVDLLARADVHEVVQRVQEIFPDFTPRAKTSFTSVPAVVADDALATVDSVFRTLVSLGIFPSCIRNTLGSRRSFQVSDRLWPLLQRARDAGFVEPPKTQLTVLFVDRLCEVSAPLAPSWTFEGAVANAFGPLDGRRVHAGEKTFPLAFHDGVLPKVRGRSFPDSLQLLVRSLDNHAQSIENAKNETDLRKKMVYLSEFDSSSDTLSSYADLGRVAAQVLRARSLDMLGGAVETACAGAFTELADALGSNPTTQTDANVFSALVGAVAVELTNADSVRQERGPELPPAAKQFLSAAQNGEKRCSEPVQQQFPHGIQPPRTLRSRNWAEARAAAGAAARAARSLNPTVSWRDVQILGQQLVENTERNPILGEKSSFHLFRTVPLVALAAACCAAGRLPTATAFPVCHGASDAATRPSDVLVYFIGGASQKELDFCEALGGRLGRRVLVGCDAVWGQADYVNWLVKEYGK